MKSGGHNLVRTENVTPEVDAAEVASLLDEEDLSVDQIRQLS